MRLDIWLVENKKAASRSQAQEMIELGQVFLLDKDQRRPLTKASFKVLSAMEIEVEVGPADRFVSRGGLKLEGVLLRIKKSVEGLDCLDIGISTGGFSDCLLKANAASVLGVDVGHGQVHSSLQGHSRLQYLEGVNARDLKANVHFAQLCPAHGFDFIVMDVSFISMTLISPQFVDLLKVGGEVLSLVKPQFEVGVQGLGKGGIVKDLSLYSEVEKKIKAELSSSGLSVLDYFDSPIQGKDGNHEFFVWARKV